MNESIDGVTSIVADLAPLSQLIGERTVKAYLAHITSPLEYGLLALSPLGVVSTLVSTIRLSRFELLKHAIGRSQEHVVEKTRELLNCVVPNRYQSFDGMAQMISLPVDDGSKPLVYLHVDTKDSDLVALKSILDVTAIEGTTESVICGPCDYSVLISTVSQANINVLMVMNIVLIASNCAITWWRYRVGDTVYGLTGYWLQILGMFMCMQSIDSTTREVIVTSLSKVYTRSPMEIGIGEKGRHVISVYDGDMSITRCIISIIPLIVGFVMNYLGLRQLPWYISLVILALTGFATLMRAYIMSRYVISRRVAPLTDYDMATELSAGMIDQLLPLLVNFHDKSLAVRDTRLMYLFLEMIAKEAHPTWINRSYMKMYDDYLLVIVFGDVHMPDRLLGISWEANAYISQKVIALDQSAHPWLYDMAIPLSTHDKEVLKTYINTDITNPNYTGPASTVSTTDSYE